MLEDPKILKDYMNEIKSNDLAAKQQENPREDRGDIFKLLAENPAVKEAIMNAAKDFKKYGTLQNSNNEVVSAPEPIISSDKAAQAQRNTGVTVR